MSPPPAWVLVAGDFVRHGGMDRANYELARLLARREGCRVHLVAHRVDEGLAALPAVHVHRVERPWGVSLLGETLLSLAARRVAAQVVRAHPDARVVVNGGNCPWPDVNWVHCVHRAWPVRDAGAPWRVRLTNRVAKRLALRAERRALQRARLVIANSRRTRQDLLERYALAPERVRVVYLGVDPERHRPATPSERAAARERLGLGDADPLAVFAGALGYDTNKGFDVLLAAWARLCAQPGFRGHLLAAGGGQLAHWQRQVDRAGLSARVRLVGYQERLEELLAAADVAVCPSRYEAFGLVALEALCRGVPALATRTSGVAERYPPALAELLLDDVEDAAALAAKLQAWYRARARHRDVLAGLAEQLRAHTWERMAEALVAAVETNPPPGGHAGQA